MGVGSWTWVVNGQQPLRLVWPAVRSHANAGGNGNGQGPEEMAAMTLAATTTAMAVVQAPAPLLAVAPSVPRVPCYSRDGRPGTVRPSQRLP